MPQKVGLEGIKSSLLALIWMDVWSAQSMEKYVFSCEKAGL